MMERTCLFTGHRDIPSGVNQLIFTKTEEMVERLIKEGYLYFCAGGALGFDTIAAFAVLKLKERYPDVRLILVLPCLSQTKGWSSEDVKTYENIKKQADKVVYTSEKYTRGCMHKRNRHLVDNSSACIAYLTKSKGGTAYTVDYAIKRGLTVFNIAEHL
ncbi:MAG: SLOG family protein [Clostridia bacterium]|nr:SLOG family protein [Clostridia bacterium]